MTGPSLGRNAVSAPAPAPEPAAGRPRRRGRALRLLLPALACFAAGLLFVRVYGVNVPSRDDWADVLTAIRAGQGELAPGELWRLHNEHRIIIPRLLFILNRALSPWDLTRVLFLVQGVQLLSALAVLRLARSELPVGWFAAVLVPACLFNFAQYENFLWCTSSQNLICILWFLAALLPLGGADRPGRRLAASFLGCLLAVLTLSAGLWGLLIVTPLVALRLQQYRRAGGSARYAAALLALWLLGTALVFAAYFRGYAPPAHHPSVAFGLSHGREWLAFLLGCAGNAFAGAGPVAARFAGALVLALFAWLALRHYPRYPRLISVAAFGFATTLALSVFRSGMGADQAFVSKYASHTLLTLAGVALVADHRLGLGPRRLFRLVVLAAVLAASVAALRPAAVYHRWMASAQPSLARLLATGVFRESGWLALTESDWRAVSAAARAARIDLAVFARPPAGSRFPVEELLADDSAAGDTGLAGAWEAERSVTLAPTAAGLLRAVRTGASPAIITRAVSSPAGRDQVLLLETWNPSEEPNQLRISWLPPGDDGWADAPGVFVVNAANGIVTRVNLYLLPGWTGGPVRFRIGLDDLSDGELVLRRFALVPTGADGNPPAR